MQTAATQPEIIYPETDGQPMVENTKQAEVMMTIKENLAERQRAGRLTQKLRELGVDIEE